MSCQPNSIRVDAVPPAPWRNGGGVTRELLRWPADDGWRLRISVADIHTDGPFSVFAGVQRWLTLLRGEGVELTFADHRQTLRPGDAPLPFDGGEAPGCRLLDGPVRDLNLMARCGAGGIIAATAGVSWCPPPGAQAGLFARVPGRWGGEGQTKTVAADSLLWFDETPAGPWRFDAFAMHATSSAPDGWWLHYQPEGVSS